MLMFVFPPSLTRLVPDDIKRAAKKSFDVKQETKQRRRSSVRRGSWSGKDGLAVANVHDHKSEDLQKIQRCARLVGRLEVCAIDAFVKKHQTDAHNEGEAARLCAPLTCTSVSLTNCASLCGFGSPSLRVHFSVSRLVLCVHPGYAK